MKKILIAFVIMFGVFTGLAHAACTSDQIDVVGDGSNCQDAKFTVTTTNMSAGDVFSFAMSATGTFYVDCGADGVLSGTGVNGKTITRTDTTEALYTCTYSTGGVKTIRMGGAATGYNTEYESNSYRKYAAIRFGSWSPLTTDGTTGGKVSSISGSIGRIFPTLGTGAGNTPVFLATFAGTQITSIPENLFNGVTGGGNTMFRGTFSNCSMLQSIPQNLFTGITGGYYKLFDSTFTNCTSLTSIPDNLFVDVIYAAGDEFFQTFMGCTSLTSIPETLFANVVYSNNSNGGYMFYYTFRGCTRLLSLPQNLFKNVPSTMTSMGRMFYGTFTGCRSLGGYIPPSFFGGLNNSGKYATAMMSDIFANTSLLTTCPSGTVQYITGYEDYWSGHVSCVDANLSCAAGRYLPANGYECSICPANSYCAGGTYAFSSTTAQGVVSCATGLLSPTGMWESAQCGRRLHFGDNVIYLRATKKTVHAMNFDLDHDGVADYFANMTTIDTPAHAGTSRRLKVEFGGQVYFVYDDTVNPGQ